MKEDKNRRKKIYTKKGDKGCVTLPGLRIWKDHPLLEALGTIDESIAYLGKVFVTIPETYTAERQQIKKIQQDLYFINALLVGLDRREDFSLGNAVKNIEKWIDAMESFLPPLHAFLFPGEDLCVVEIHVARTICRRAERSCVHFLKDSLLLSEVAPYLNRLSDYLFVLARWMTDQRKGKEALFQENCIVE